MKTSKTLTKTALQGKVNTISFLVSYYFNIWRFWLKTSNRLAKVHAWIHALCYHTGFFVLVVWYLRSMQFRVCSPLCDFGSFHRYEVVLGVNFIPGFPAFTSTCGDAIFFFAAHRVDSRFVQGLVGTYEVRFCYKTTFNLVMKISSHLFAAKHRNWLLPPRDRNRHILPSRYHGCYFCVFSSPEPRLWPTSADARTGTSSRT